MAEEDWPAVERIYAEGIATRNATFDTEPPGWDDFDSGRLPGHRLVAVEAGEVVGWAALSPTSRASATRASSRTPSTSPRTRGGEASVSH